MWFQSKRYVPSFLSFIHLFAVVLGTIVTSDTSSDPKTININIYGQDCPAQAGTNINVPLPSCDCGENEWFSIQSTSGGLVLDASDPNQVKLQPSAGNETQLWKFERASRPGTFYIINKHTKGVLDVAKDEKRMKIVVAEKKTGSLTQQWITNWNHRLRNFGTNFNLDVASAKFEPGTSLIAWAENGNKAQEFILEREVQ